VRRAVVNVRYPARRSPGPSLALLLSLCAAACSDDSTPAEAPDNSDSMDDMNDVSMGGTGGGDSQGDGTDFSERGVCGARANGVVTVEDFQIKEERYLLGDEGRGSAICVVSFDVTRVGDAPPGCDESARVGGQQDECLWTHLVQYGNPTVAVDEDGVCTNSELEMNADAIAALDGLQVAYGYVFEYIGHNSVLMIYDNEQEIWEPGTNVGWDEMTGDFLFDERRGFCNYAPGAP
jgi:hypothetical protein